MAVRWEDQIDQEFTVEMRIELEHEKGLIAMLASTITGVDANIERISILERDARSRQSTYSYKSGTASTLPPSSRSCVTFTMLIA